MLELIRSPAAVARHAFWPLIYFEVKGHMPKYKRRDGEAHREKKTRPIMYASHIDSAIFRQYAAILSRHYEDALKQHGLDNEIIAYRAGKGPAYKHAIEAFRFIQQYDECEVIAFDISDFFGSLDHGVLKHAWQDLLQIDRLPSDHYKVFRAVTRYAYVKREVFQSDEFQEGRARICTAKEFDELIRKKKLIEWNRCSKGIPQGTPISAVLSNIYMFYEFDIVLRDYVQQYKGLYRRYADDILLVLPNGPPKEEAETIVQAALQNLKLTESREKRASKLFTRGGREGKPFQYLGLTFDGKHIGLRPSSVSRFYRKMRSGVLAKGYVARQSGGTVWTKRLRRKYTHEGHKTFYNYARQVAAASEDKTALRQLRKHSLIFEKQLKRAQKIAKTKS